MAEKKVLRGNLFASLDRGVRRFIENQCLAAMAIAIAFVVVITAVVAIVAVGLASSCVPYYIMVWSQTIVHACQTPKAKKKAKQKIKATTN